MEFLCSWERGIPLVSIENLQVQGSFYLKMTKDELCNSQKKWAACRTKLCFPSSRPPLLLAPGSGSYSRLGVQPKTLHSPLTVLFFSYPLIQSCWLLKLYADSVTVLQLHLQGPIRPSHHQLLPGRLRQPLTQAACFHPGPPCSRQSEPFKIQVDSANTLKIHAEENHQRMLKPLGNSLLGSRTFIQTPSCLQQRREAPRRVEKFDGI